MKVDMPIAAVAAAQLGVFTRAQAIGCGATDALIRHRLETGRWVRVHSRVFRLAGTPVTWDQSLFAAWLAAGQEAVVSHTAAARTWGMPRIDARLELTVPPPRMPRLEGATVHRTLVERVDRVTRDGLLVTSPTRTLLDLAAALDADSLEAILDHCLSRRLTTADHLARRLESRGRRGRRGMGRLAALLEARPSGSRAPESDFERQLLRVLSRLDGPPPVPQYEVVLPDGSIARFDAAYPYCLVAIEADNYTYHSSRLDWSVDRVRNRAATALGWRILPVTYDDLTRRPSEFLELVDRARPPQVRA